MPNNIDKYYLHLFVGLVPWLFFSGSMTGGQHVLCPIKIWLKRFISSRGYAIVLCYKWLCKHAILFYCNLAVVFFFSGVGFNPAALLCFANHYACRIYYGIRRCNGNICADSLF